MDTCSGDGTCFKQCYHHGNLKHPKFFGGTSRHDVYCKDIVCHNNCQLQECKGYNFCLQKRPQRVLNCHNGRCINCAVEEYAKQNPK